ncbi:hypothetical protein [Nocardioides sp. 503]|uniref:hypothetical protein n=1 Tax=Nocardioides sp. 503 TaxID=2508326 RepID=UPI00107010EB|nr:hypothetical protein [Nocardioides sp. 503]
MHPQPPAPADAPADLEVAAAWPRVAAMRIDDPAAPDRVLRLTTLAERGLAAGYDAGTGSFAQTVRGVSGGHGVRVRSEGASLRYTAMAALGIGRLPEAAQREILGGRTAGEVALRTAERALDSDDPGAVALAVWAGVELTGSAPGVLLDRLGRLLRERRSLPTVDAAWMLTAAVAAADDTDTGDIVGRAAALLRRHHGPGGTYPHVLPPHTQSRVRAHVGSFADQVYPLQAFARASRLTGERWMLELADQTAAAICAAQGPAGQWWWHYDCRDGSVVEPYPVYSVHQHAMAPMVLFDLREAGGADHRPAIRRGLEWVDTHPEVVEELVTERFGLVWRKVGRREPRKAARALASAVTSVRRGATVPGIDRVLPPSVVDHECRPYELGWLLYAWLAPIGRRSGVEDA